MRVVENHVINWSKCASFRIYPHGRLKFCIICRLFVLQANIIMIEEPTVGNSLPVTGVMRKGGAGFSGSVGAVPRKVVDYSAGVVKMLEVRLYYQSKLKAI